MPKLHIWLLGGFQLLVDGAPVPSVHQPRLQAFLAYLCLHSATPQSRQHLAFTFWPDVAEFALQADSSGA